MAVDMFLKLDTVDGESVDNVHKKEIDVDGFEFGATQAGTLHVATGGGSGKVSVQDMKIEKFVDLASFALFRSVCSGEHFPTAILTVRKAGKTPVEYIVITMTEVMITSYQTGGTEADERTRETIHLNFAKVKFQYKSQKADGSEDQTKDVTWDIAKNYQA